MDKNKGSSLASKLNAKAQEMKTNPNAQPLGAAETTLDPFALGNAAAASMNASVQTGADKPALIGADGPATSVQTDPALQQATLRNEATAKDAAAVAAGEKPPVDAAVIGPNAVVLGKQAEKHVLQDMDAVIDHKGIVEQGDAVQPLSSNSNTEPFDIKYVPSSVEAPKGSYIALKLHRLILKTGASVLPTNGYFVANSQEEHDLLEYYNGLGTGLVEFVD